MTSVMLTLLYDVIIKIGTNSKKYISRYERRRYMLVFVVYMDRFCTKPTLEKINTVKTIKYNVHLRR